MKKTTTQNLSTPARVSAFFVLFFTEVKGKTQIIIIKKLGNFILKQINFSSGAELAPAINLSYFPFVFSLSNFGFCYYSSYVWLGHFKH